MTLLLSVCCLNISDVGDIIAQYKHQLELTNTAPSATQQLAFNNSQGSLSALNNNQPQPQQQPQQQQQQQQLQQSQLQLSLGEYQSVLIERIATLGSKVTQKSSTLSSITKEFQNIVPICLYMVCKHWSSHVRRSYRILGVFAVQKTRIVGMCCAKCNTFEHL